MTSQTTVKSDVKLNVIKSQGVKVCFKLGFKRLNGFCTSDRKRQVIPEPRGGIILPIWDVHEMLDSGP